MSGRTLAALAGWAVVVGTVVAVDAQHALNGSRLAIAVVAAATVGLGLVALRRGVVAVVLLIPLSALEGGSHESALLLIFVAPVVLALLAAGIGSGYLLRRWRWTPIAGGSLLAGALLAVVLALLLELRVVDRDPVRPLAVDPAPGTFEQIRIGAPKGSLPGGLARRADSFDPPGESLSGPSSFRGDVTAFVRPRLAVLVAGERIAGFVTSDPSAELEGGRGVGVGDSLEVAEDRLDGLDCGGVSLGSDSNEAVYDACSRTRGGRTLWLGGDPIDSIWLYEERG